MSIPLHLPLRSPSTPPTTNKESWEVKWTNHCNDIAEILNPTVFAKEISQLHYNAFNLRYSLSCRRGRSRKSIQSQLNDLHRDFYNTFRKRVCAFCYGVLRTGAHATCIFKVDDIPKTTINTLCPSCMNLPNQDWIEAGTASSFFNLGINQIRQEIRPIVYKGSAMTFQNCDRQWSQYYKYDDVYQFAVAVNGVTSAQTGDICAGLGGAIFRLQGSDLLPFYT